MTDGPARDRQVLRIILIEGSANLAVLAAKLVVGLSTGSLAVVADAIHSLTDVANNVVAWTVVRQSGRPADREHAYGHRKFETVAVFALATLLVVLAFELALHAVKREHVRISHEPWGLWVMLGVLVVNVVVATWQRSWARRLRSDILLADASHTFADVLITTAVLVGWQLSALGYPWLDTLCALGVAAIVVYLAYGLFRRAFPVLVDRIAIEPEPLIAAVEALPGVRRVWRVRSRWVGSAKAVDMVIGVDPALSAGDAHAIADQVEDLLERHFGVEDCSIHVEPDV